MWKSHSNNGILVIITSEIAGFVLKTLGLTGNCPALTLQLGRESALLGNNKYKPFKKFNFTLVVQFIFLK